MSYFEDSNLIIDSVRKAGKRSCDVLTDKNGCESGCKAGFTFVEDTEYGKGGVHDDQEGFLVISGTGTALIGDEEHKIYPGISMIAPKGVRHIFKRDKDSEPVKIFWFHSAV